MSFVTEMSGLRGSVFADLRILERQLANMDPTSVVTHSPVVHSGLSPAAGQSAGQSAGQNVAPEAGAAAPPPED